MKGKRQTSLRHIGSLLMEEFGLLFIVMTLVIAFLFFSVIRMTGSNVVQMFLMSAVFVSVPAYGVCWLLMVDARRREWVGTGVVGRNGPWRQWRRRGFIVMGCCMGAMALLVAVSWRQMGSCPDPAKATSSRQPGGCAEGAR
jgi:hypothetical protein